MITLKYLAPKSISAIGIVGAGTQAKLQLKYLHQVTDCKHVVIWSRDKHKSIAFKNQFKDTDFLITVASTLDELTEKCNVIITTTPSKEPLLKASQVQPGTHITAIGSDTSEKIELESEILKKADIVVSDSILQSNSRGEIFQARKQDCLIDSNLLELGNLIQNPYLGRINSKQITIADLTGVAVQDIAIASAVFNNYKLKRNEN